MKILVIWRLLTVGGVNAGWRNRARYFKKHGINTEFLCMKDHGGLHMMDDVAKVYLTKDKRKIIQIIKENNYDLIIVVDTGYAFPWIEKAGYKGPVIVEARTPELKKLTPHLENIHILNPRVIIVPSEYQRRLVSILTDKIPVSVIYNGIDTSVYHVHPEETVDFASIPSVPSGKKIIGWIGRLDARKNWQKLIEIAQCIKKERNDIEIWVIGGAQSVQREQFATVYREEGLTDIIQWHPVIPYQQMPHVYAKIRESGGITLATTKVESFGNTFIESMVCGVPVVAARMMPVTEIVVDGATGLLYEQNKTDDALRKIYTLIDHPDLHARLSRQAIAHVKKNFSIENVAKQYVQLIETIVTDPQAGGKSS